MIDEKEDFHTDTYPDPTSSQAEGEGEELRETMKTSEESGKRSSWRLFLLMLLLLVAGGAGLFFFFGASDPPVAAPPSPRVEKRLIVPPSVATASSEKEQGAGSPAQNETKEAPPAASAVVPSGKGASSAPAVSAPESAGGSQDVAVAETAKGESPSSAPAVESDTKASASPAPAKRFVLETKAVLLPAELGRTEKALARLGYEPVRLPVQQTVSVTRLLIGVYPAAEAVARLEALRSVVPSAFPLRRGEEIALYAGSYRDLDRARIFADELYEKGIRVEEESAQVSLEGYRLRFGAFADEKEAAGAAARLKKMGVESNAARLR